METREKQGQQGKKKKILIDTVFDFLTLEI